MIRKTFEELKLSGQLPTPTGVGMKILELTQRENFSADEIGRAISADPALTGQLLRIANSAQIGSAEPISTVSDATMRLGLRAVRNVALGLSLLSAHRTGVCKHFDYDRYWSTSLARAISAHHLSRTMRVATPAEAYIVALLSEIGNLALASIYPEKYSKLLESRDTVGTIEFARLERETFDIGHSEISAYMLEEWGLPASYGHAVRLYEQHGACPPGTPTEVEDFVSILRGAQFLSGVLTTSLEGASKTDLLRTAASLERLRSSVRMSTEEFFRFFDAITAEWDEWGAMLGVPTPPVPDLRALCAGPVDGAPSSATPERVSTREAAARAPASNPEADVEGLRILAVDDDATSLKVLERHLVRAGHRVVCARNGRAALQLALETNPQVVIADWMMPELDGIELCKALRRIESGRDMFFLLLTGRGEEDRVVEAFDAGVDDYVVKPFNPKLLMARLKGGQRVIELKEKVENDRQVMLKQVAELGLLTRKLRTAALTDVLTELPNRRYVIKRLEQEWDTSRRTGRPLALIMIDIDHFKKVNDVHGHDVGDLVLRETANVLRTHTRTGEEPSRLGGEEFLVICSNTTSEQAHVCAERIRAAVEANTIRGPAFTGSVTVSMGVAEMHAAMPGIDALLKAADDAVYQAKDLGRNQIRIAPREGAQTKSA